MIADVRLKVRLRLRALIETFVHEYRSNPYIHQLVDLARTDSKAAALAREGYRQRVQNAFPGSVIVYTPTRILVTLPPTYPRSCIPVDATYPRELTPILFGIPSTEPF